MLRGEVWWAEFPKPVGARPVLLLSRDRAISIREFVTVAEITTTIRNIPVEVPLGKEDGLPKHCVINLDVLNTIPKKMLVRYMAQLSPEKLRSVESALKFALGMD